MTTWVCEKCGRSYPDTGKSIRCICRAGGSQRFVQAVSNGGPGTELKAMLDAIGVEEKADCSCRTVRIKMDQWGVAGCQEPANFAWIVSQMHTNAAKYSWTETLQIAMATAVSPLAFVIDPMDIYGSLAREAIRRADANSR